MPVIIGAITCFGFFTIAALSWTWVARPVRLWRREDWLMIAMGSLASAGIGAVVGLLLLIDSGPSY